VETPEVEVARYAAKIALWALICSGGSLVVAGGLLALEIRRRLDEGVKLSMTIMAEALMVGGMQQDDNTYVAASVTNRGSAPTTITHLVLFNYPNRIAKWLPRLLTRWMKKQRPKTFIIANTGAPGPLPYVLHPGHNWMGTAKHTPELAQMIKDGHLYVGVIGSHSEKTLFKRARPAKLPKDAKKV
jgi:hypothetical protein